MDDKGGNVCHCGETNPMNLDTNRKCLFFFSFTLSLNTTCGQWLPAVLPDTKVTTPPHMYFSLTVIRRFITGATQIEVLYC